MMKPSLPILFALLGLVAVAQLAQAGQESSKTWLDSPRENPEERRDRVHEGSR